MGVIIFVRQRTRPAALSGSAGAQDTRSSLFMVRVTMTPALSHSRVI